MSVAPSSKHEVKQLNRYPGLRPFVKSDNLIFFGRNTETEQLLDSIRVNQSFILFGKSGLGKSSLINAGIVPRLTAENFCPVLIRFYNAKRDPHEVVAEELQKYISEETHSGNPSQKQTLSQLLSRWSTAQKPVLIFDQFEEFFYYDSKKRESFISELAFVVNNELLASADTASQQPALSARKIDVKLLFLIRSDRLNLMNEISEKIPGIFNNRYQLKPLLKQKAEQAVVLPAQIEDEENGQVIFKTQPYEYAPEAIQLILNSLSNKDGEIESSQLQIICQELEEIALARFAANNKKAKLNNEVLINPKDFNGEQGLKEILNKFYWKQLGKLAADSDVLLLEKKGKEWYASEPEAKPAGSRQKAAGADNGVVNQVRKLIENELVSGGKRVIQSETKVREYMQEIYPHVTLINDKDKADVIIDKLLDLRLIREEDSHLGKVYEISHDTLLESVIRARTERKKKEDAEKLREGEKRLADQKKKTELEEKLKEKAREERAAATTAKNDAVKAQRVAKKAEKEALQAKEKAETEREKAIEAERKSSRHLRYAILSLLMAVVLGGIALYGYFDLKEERSKNQANYAQLLKFNAARAYADDNHAMAFNLASQADDLLDDNHQLIDSFLHIWDLKEYSGKNVQTSADEKTIACRYGNGSVQVFRIKDSVRKNNPSITFADADDFTLAKDGSAIAFMDTVLQTIRFYQLYNANKDWDTVLLLKQKFVNVPGLVNLMNDSYFISSRIDSTLQVIGFKKHTDTVFNHINPLYTNPHYLGKTKFYLYVNPMFQGDYTTVINLADNHIESLHNWTMGLNLKIQKTPYLINEDEKRVYRFSGDAFVPILNVGKITDFNSYNTLFETDGSYVLDGWSGYTIINKANSSAGNLPGSVSVEFTSDFPFVQYNNKQVAFISADSLSLISFAVNFSKQPISIGNARLTKTFQDDYAFAFLSANGNKVYYLNDREGSVAVVSLYPAPRFYRIGYKPGTSLKLRTLDLFKTGSGLMSIDNVTKDYVYWRKYYEQPE